MHQSHTYINLSRRFRIPAIVLCLLISPITAQLTDLEVLELFYVSCNGQNWTVNTSWLDRGLSICEWFGITCNDSAGVEQVELRNNNLACTLPAELFYLPDLKVLDLDANEDITAEFTSLDTSAVAKIEYLSLSESSTSTLLGAAAAFANSLVSLSVAGSSLTGLFPTDVLQLSQLQQLDLSHNFLSGQIPDALGNLAGLRALSLAHNFFSGQLPPALGNLSILCALLLQFNQFEGTIPTEIGQLTGLTSLSLNDQVQWGGEVGGITGPLLHFADLPYLFLLNLGNNLLTGSIPFGFLASIDVSFSDLLLIDLSQNKLSGRIPAGLRRYSSLRIFLIQNEISEIPAVLCNQTDWMHGDVSLFGCDAILCHVGSANIFGRQISVDFPCESCPDGFTSYFGSTDCDVETGAASLAPFSNRKMSSSDLKATSDGVAASLRLDTKQSVPLSNAVRYPSAYAILMFLAFSAIQVLQ